MDAPMAPVGSGQDIQRMMLYDANKKSAGVAYLLWLFLGFFGAHRFYTGRTGSGAAMLVVTLISYLLTFVLIGYLPLAFIFLVWVVDAFQIPGWIRDHNTRLIASLQ